MRRLLKQAALATALVIALSCAVPALAVSDIPYDSYIYNYRGYIEFTPAPYVPDGSVSGRTLGIGDFVSPQDVCVAPNGLIYVADTEYETSVIEITGDGEERKITGTGRIVVISEDMTRPVMEIHSFLNDGQIDTFKKPCGVTVSDRNLLYIADRDNNRIVILNEERTEAVQIVENPTSEMLPEGYVFFPEKVEVDYAERVYVTAKYMHQGIMVFASEGDFMSFFGTISVTTSFWQRLWRRFSTKAQRDRGNLFIATEFTGIDVDPAGFVYASCIDPAGEQAAFRLNPKGEDVIKKGENGNVGGDLDKYPYGPYAGASYIVDIIIRDKGIFSILDSQRGRIFTYDSEGNMLYTFGGLGVQTGTFKAPCAMAVLGDRILVLDADRRELMVFSETDYGRLINEAVGLRYDGNEKLAVALWEQVLVLNENLELANVGIGKAYLTEGNNKEAMKHLKLGMNRTYYSIAFKRYRNDLLKQNLGYILTAAIALSLGLYVWRTVKHKGEGKGDLLADD
ncbi:MAG: gluconolactonase [Oscillospiraceae bacterium]|nr:gluconolactonase [Oscillospiraceae bacterium]